MHHEMTIILPSESRSDVVKLNLATGIDHCLEGSTCSVLIDALAFRLADSGGNPLSSAFSPNANLKNFVTYVRDVPHQGHPFATKANLIDAVFDTAPKASRWSRAVSSWPAGTQITEPYGCKGKVEGQSLEQDFVKFAHVTFVIPASGKLQVFKANDTKWRDIAIAGFNFAISVTNDADPKNHDSHFDMYAALYKKKTPNEPALHLPNEVVQDLQTCAPVTSTAAFDTVPGCSTSAWP